jgi:hypothetical protein
MAQRGGFVFGARFVLALVVVLVTFNPTGHSFVHWVRASLADGTAGPVHAFVGVVLAIGWAVLLTATLRSLGALGLFLACAFFGTLVWWLADSGVLPVGGASAVTWIALVCLAGVLSLGVAWGHLWRRLTGRVEVDESGED